MSPDKGSLQNKFSVKVGILSQGGAYLIFVTNAANAVRVKFLAECKKNSEKREIYCFGLRLYHNSDHVNVLFYTKCNFAPLSVFYFTLGV